MSTKLQFHKLMNNKNVLFLFLVCFFSTKQVNGCDFTTSNEWSCIPCGGDYSCYGVDSCFANPQDLEPQCSLPFGAENWQCCQSDSCSVKSPYICDYIPVQPTLTPTLAPATDGDTCSIKCASYQTCQCICIGCSGVGSGCFQCKTESWFLALVIIIPTGIFITVIGFLAFKFIYKKKNSNQGGLSSTTPLIH